MFSRVSNPNKQPNYAVRRLIALGMVASIGYGVAEVSASAISAFASKSVGGEVPSIPNATTQKGRDEIAKLELEGKLVQVRIDQSNPHLSTIYNLADTLTNTDPGILATSLEIENGGTTNVHDMQVLDVPTSSAATALHDKQFHNK